MRENIFELHSKKQTKNSESEETPKLTEKESKYEKICKTLPYRKTFFHVNILQGVYAKRTEKKLKLN